MIAALARWVDQRIGLGEYAAKGARKVFPEHWSFLLGEVALYSFVVLIATGTFLAMFFDSSLDHVVYDGSYAPLQGREITSAYNSVLDISFDVRAGLLMRQIHHWAALIFVAAIVVHVARIFFTGAFRRPRELNWVIGVTLLLFSIIEGFAGYSLPDDLLSGTGLRIGYSIAQSFPVIGEWLAFLIWGGEYPGTQIINRLFIGHVWILPLLMLGLITVHLLLVVRQKHTQFPGPGKTNRNVVGDRFWPTYTAKSMGLFFVLAALMTALGAVAQINPVWLYGPYEVSTVTTGAQPDWYMGWIEGALRLLPPVAIVAFGFEIPNVFFAGALLPLLTFIGLYAYPFLEQRLTGAAAREHHLLDRPREHPWRTAFGAGALTFYTVLFFAGSNDIIAEQTGARVETIITLGRLSVLLLPPVVALLTFRICDQLRTADTHRARKLHLQRMSEAEERL